MKPKRKVVKSMWAVIDDETGQIVIYEAGQGAYPMCSPDPNHLTYFKKWGADLFKKFKRPMSIRRFEYTKDIEVFSGPVGVESGTQ